ncbi:hypothetical protein JBL43_08705 [Aureibaculum sp. A20]|uniref:Cytochrome oxidase complex assembly protein 1 n=1 Tax=Aureibaculum flavum TaxID=2795986 RepID=A0ABS0WQR0_9FLAO|nr:cytochrome c oxidase assembly factor Coa1 family protein [Aureibaculum flavum]MBJ2174316.1 hypothetical protein [Aureibaculum flavum]
MNELIKQESWWNRNWKWFLPLIGVTVVIVFLIFSEVGGMSVDIAKAYSEPDLYDNAFEKVKSDKRVIELLGEIEPTDKLAILEGVVKYSNEKKTVYTSIRIIGTKGSGRVDISADLIDNVWNYKKINVRIRRPVKNKQTIEVLTSSE